MLVNQFRSTANNCMYCKHDSFIHSFIHIEYLYSASSKKLLRSAPNTSTVKQSSLKVRKKCKVRKNAKIVFNTNEFGTSLSSIIMAHFLMHVQNLMIVQINRDDFPVSFHIPLRERDGYKQSINSWNGRRIYTSRLKQGQ